MTLGSYTLIKNEIRFIKNHIDSWVDYLDEMVFFDGNSTDGTLEVLREYAAKNSKIKVFENKDPKDLTDDYVRLFNECMRSLDTDVAMFLHPDMFLVMWGKLPEDLVAGTAYIKSYAGEPGGPIYQITGRGERWKNIYRLRNPDLGAHYFGHYGAQNEDTYFSEITGDSHFHYGQSFGNYPYDVFHSNIEIAHYSDVRPYARRLDRMIKCLINQGHTKEEAEKIAPLHPRVSLKDGMGFKFIPAEAVHA